MKHENSVSLGTKTIETTAQNMVAWACAHYFVKGARGRIRGKEVGSGGLGCVT